MWFRKDQEKEEKEENRSVITPKTKDARLRAVMSRVFQNTNPKDVATQDNVGVGVLNGTVPLGILEWFSNQSFIGYQACMIMSQHWLVSAACEMPVSDAIRKGWMISGNDGNDVDIKTITALKKCDKEFKKTLKEFGTFGRVYGYRIAIFLIEGFTESDYKAPFNIDGLKAGEFEGIVQPDPQFVTPIIESNDPASIGFYEPEFYQVNGIKYHKSHCVIYKHCDTIGQQLKPVYQYGSVPLPQQLYEQVYQADLGAGEANKLLMTKRLWVQNMSLEEALLNQTETERRLKFITDMRDNYGMQTIDSDDTISQFETALSEVTNVIAQQYQFVAAIARIPVNKLMQTQLQGFAASGEAESETYRETLETISDKLKPLVEKFTLYNIKNLGLEPFDFDVVFNPQDSLTEEQLATINTNKAAADNGYLEHGVVDAQEVRNRLMNDENSGYSGLSEILEDELDYSDDDDEAD